MRGAITAEYGWLDGGGKSLPVNSPNCSQAASVLMDELPREAFGEPSDIMSDPAKLGFASIQREGF